MTMEARNRPLPTWFQMLEGGQIRLPRFQRFEAWSHSEISGLLESVLRGLPAGATLILQVGDREQFISRPVAGINGANARVIEQLLDGQQRLTALWRAFHDTYEDRSYFVYFAKDEDEITQLPKVFGQARWIRNNQRFPLWADVANDVWERGYIPLRLIRPGDTAAEVERWCDEANEGDLLTSREASKIIQRLREQVNAFNIPFLELPAGTPKDVALDVFIKLNTTAIPLTPFDIIVAQVEEATEKSLHDLVGELKAKAPEIDYYSRPSELILNVAALREDRAPTQASYQRLDLDRLVNEWEALTDGIDWALEFLASEGILDGQRLPTVAVVPVISGLHDFIAPSLDARGNAVALLRKYIWRAFLTRRYENAAASRALQDFRGLRAILRGEDLEPPPIFDESQYPLPTPEEIKQAAWPKGRDILARGILAVTLKQGAVDFADASPLTRERLAHREYHHLFPDHLLTDDGGLSSGESSLALNCALVTWKTNRHISAKEPMRYLRERTEQSTLGEDEVKRRLDTHLVPYEALAVGGYDLIGDPEERRASILRDFQIFLSKRTDALMQPIRALCDGQLWP
jgi:hypothetical protein